MDKLVGRVTVLEGSGPTRETRTVYDGREEEYPTIPIDGIVGSVTVIEGRGAGRSAKVVHRSRHWEHRAETARSGENSLRRFLRADMIRATETYERHLESAKEDRQLWWLDIPANMVRAFIKAGQEEKRARREEAEARGSGDVKSGLRDLQDDLKAAGADVKSHASDLAGKAEGAR